jgi:hypothetical protein
MSLWSFLSLASLVSSQRRSWPLRIPVEKLQHFQKEDHHAPTRSRGPVPPRHPDAPRRGRGGPLDPRRPGRGGGRDAGRRAIPSGDRLCRSPERRRLPQPRRRGDLGLRRRQPRPRDFHQRPGGGRPASRPALGRDRWGDLPERGRRRALGPGAQRRRPGPRRRPGGLRNGLCPARQRSPPAQPRRRSLLADSDRRAGVRHRPGDRSRPSPEPLRRHPPGALHQQEPRRELASQPPGAAGLPLRPLAGDRSALPADDLPGDLGRRAGAGRLPQRRRRGELDTCGPGDAGLHRSGSRGAGKKRSALGRGDGAPVPQPRPGPDLEPRRRRPPRRRGAHAPAGRLRRLQRLQDASRDGRRRFPDRGPGRGPGRRLEPVEPGAGGGRHPGPRPRSAPAGAPVGRGLGRQRVPDRHRRRAVGSPPQ